MEIIGKNKDCITIQLGGEQVVFFNKFGVAWETMLDDALNSKKGPKWKRIEFCDAIPESLVSEFLLSAGATRQHNGRGYVYDFTNLALSHVDLDAGAKAIGEKVYVNQCSPKEAAKACAKVWKLRTTA